MTDLDLKDLDRLEKEMQGKVMSTNVSDIHEQLRPLLDLVERLKRTLLGMPCTWYSNYNHGCDKGMYPKVPGRWCPRCRGLEYYRVAKGE